MVKRDNRELLPATDAETLKALRGWIRSNLKVMLTSHEGQQLIHILGGRIEPARVVFPREE